MTTNHDACCCTETLNELRFLNTAHYRTCLAVVVANHDRDELTNALAAAIAERDRARDTAARLEAELARGFRTAAPDVTLNRTHNGAPGTPNNPDPGPSGALGRPGSENAPPDTRGPERGHDTDSR